MCTGCVGNEKKIQTNVSQSDRQGIQTTVESSGYSMNPTTTPTVEPWVSSSLWDGPVVQPQKELSTSVSANKDALDHKITVTYNGGGGQQLIKDIQVKTIQHGGKVGVSPLGKNKGDSIVIQGTNKTDRIEVAVWFMDNTSYKIFDQNFSENKSPLSL